MLKVWFLKGHDFGLHLGRKKRPKWPKLPGGRCLYGRIQPECCGNAKLCNRNLGIEGFVNPSTWRTWQPVQASVGFVTPIQHWRRNGRYQVCEVVSSRVKESVARATENNVMPRYELSLSISITVGCFEFWVVAIFYQQFLRSVCSSRTRLHWSTDSWIMTPFLGIFPASCEVKVISPKNVCKYEWIFMYIFVLIFDIQNRTKHEDIYI